MNDTCETCRFAEPKRDYGRTQECRRHAPAGLTVPHWHDLRQYIPIWPVMEPYNWCGDFEKRKEVV